MTKFEIRLDQVDSMALSRELQAVLDIPVHELLARGRGRAKSLGLSFAGTVYPPEAWSLFRRGQTVLVDVRTIEERKYVGHVPQSLHLAWKFGTAMSKNPRFQREFEKLVPDKSAVILLLCRSGKRSSEAAEALTLAGYANVFNVLEGFEGELDGNQHRGEHDGWRHWGLPWIQD